MATNVIPGYGGYGAFHSYDLTTPQGLRLLIERTATDARMAIEARWEQGLAGVSPQQLADELTDDFMSQSQSLPRGAFREDPRRELLILRNLYRYSVERQIRLVVNDLFSTRDTFPPASQSQQPPRNATPSRPQRRLHGHDHEQEG